MTRTITASAPGKLVIVGEYAVVYGAPALVSAVPRRALVRLTPREDQRWVVTTPGLTTDHNTTAMRFADAADLGLNQRLPLLGSVLKSLNYRGPGQTVELNTQAFYANQDIDSAKGSGPGPIKLGLGSSAALCTALMAALTAEMALNKPDCDPDPALKPLELPVNLAEVADAHRVFQGGRGSGIDVAASYLGGSLRFRRNAQAPFDTVHQIVKLPLPMVWIWSGKSAATTARLDILRRFQTDQPEQFATLTNALSRLSASACDAADTGRAEDFVAAVRNFTSVLAELDRTVSLGVWTPEHQQIAAIAERCGVFYKTSGAGGGDCGLAMDSDPARLQKLRQMATEQGFASWILGAETRGLTLK